MLEKLFSSVSFGIVGGGGACQCMGELRDEVVSLVGVLRFELTYKVIDYVNSSFYFIVSLNKSNIKIGNSHR